MRGRHLTRAFNDAQEDEFGKREQLIKELFGSTGERISVVPPFH